jgi:PAS domain S-box-containing protein
MSARKTPTVAESTDHLEALRKSEERYRRLVEATDAGYVVVDKTGTVLDANREYVRLSGHDRLHQILGRRVVEWTAEEEQEKNATAVATCMKDGFVRNFEITYIDKTGKRTLVEINATAVETAGEEPVLFLCRDISECKSAEASLRKALERLDLATRAAHLGIWDWDIPKNELVWDDRMYELYGIKREDFAGAYEAWLAGIHPDDREASDHISQQARLGGGEYRTEFRVVWPDGTVRHLRAYGQVVRDANGKPLRMTGTNYDITERKHAEQALREKEARYRALVESSPDAITQSDLSGKILMCNSQAARLHGYERAEDLIGTSVFSLFPPEELARTRINLQKTLKDGVTRNTEYRLLKKDGSQFQAELSATVITDAGGTPTSFMAMTRDIGERRRMEEALRQSEERFSRLAQASFEGVAIHDREKILDANQAMASLFGYELSELVGMNVLDLAAPESRDLVRVNSLAGYDKPYEAIGLRKDGSTLAGELNSRPITYQGRVVRVTAIHDMSERKRGEEAIAAERERLAVTLRSIGDGVITTDLRGHIVLMNRVAEDVTGWTQSAAQGQPLEAVFAVIDEITREPCENPVTRVLSTGQISELANHTVLIARDGTERIVADSGAPIRDRDGETIGVVLVFRDMTEKRKSLDALQRAAKLDSLGVLAGGIAHDFNNLLAGIFGYIDLARTVSKDAKTIEYLDATLATMNRARALTLQLLTFAKGGAPVQRVTPLTPFIQDTVQFALSGSSVACRFSLAERLWSCNIDKNQIGQVVDNIVINAQQAMPNGGTVEVTARNVSLEEGACPALAKGNYVKVSIKDTGIGIARDIMPRIFDPFYTTKTKGHGLGLATCYSIMSRHGGWIDVESEPGKGSTFHVYLPASTEVGVAGREESVRYRGSGTIVVVDDEPVIRTTVRRMLESLGYGVVCRGDGAEAVDLYVEESMAGNAFAAMILDLTIRGGMGGQAAVAEIRKLDRSLPVFVASGYADDPVMRNPAKFGFTASICKPFTIAELAKMLDGNLRK